jgi:hypothetical protein
MINSIPEKVRDVATIELEKVHGVIETAEQIIRLEREPTDEDKGRLRKEFDQMDAAKRYRGKFTYGFFMKWLELLARDRNEQQSIQFKALERPRSVNYSGLSLGMLASKSSLPPGLLSSSPRSDPS